jgi:hypothetical protein
MRTYVLAAPVALLLSGSLLVSASNGAAGRQGHGDLVAHAARTVYLREYGSLRLTKEGSETLYERGQATGTFRGMVVARLSLHAKSVDATFTIYPKGGAVTGQAHAAFIISGSTGYYGGSLKITKASGVYRHAKGTKVGVSGTINRQTFALTVKANGWISY